MKNPLVALLLIIVILISGVAGYSFAPKTTTTSTISTITTAATSTQTTSQTTTAFKTVSTTVSEYASVGCSEQFPNGLNVNLEKQFVTTVLTETNQTKSPPQICIAYSLENATSLAGESVSENFTALFSVFNLVANGELTTYMDSAVAYPSNATFLAATQTVTVTYTIQLATPYAYFQPYGCVFVNLRENNSTQVPLFPTPPLCVYTPLQTQIVGLTNFQVTNDT